jgi:pseudouridine kinase
MNDILVIGGSNIDYSAKALKPIIPADSNIGTLEVSFGGVARNVVENLARLGNKVTFVTAIGNDAQGKACQKALQNLKVKVCSPKLPYLSSSYLALFDNKGDMKVAICDTTIMDKMTFRDLLPFRDVISKHNIIVLDANLNGDVIDSLFKSYFSHQFFVEGVSANKVGRFRHHLKEITLFKSNLLEANYLCGEKNKDAVYLAKKLIAAGVKSVVITQGPKPVVAAQDNKIFTVPVPKVETIVNASGAGDALFAGIIHELHSGHSLKEAILFGVTLSNLTLASPKAVNPAISKCVD